MLFGLLAPLITPACAFTYAACTCLPPADPRTPAEARRYVDGAAAVFDGVVVRITQRSPQEAATDPERATTLMVTLRFRRQWRGMAMDSIVVTTSMFAEMCGVEFALGGKYFVIADAVVDRARPLSISGRRWPLDHAGRAGRVRALAMSSGSLMHRSGCLTCRYT